MLENREPLTIYGDGTETRDYAYVVTRSARSSPLVAQGWPGTWNIGTAVR